MLTGSFPVVPIVYRVYGCSPKTVNSTETTDCPTQGYHSVYCLQTDFFGLCIFIFGSCVVLWLQTTRAVALSSSRLALFLCSCSGLTMTLCGEGFLGTPINQIDSSP
jgi:hypothetical protein